MDKLQEVAKRYQSHGWVITQMMVDSFIATRPGPRPGWTILVAILFFPLGLIALTVKGEPISTLVTRADAEQMGGLGPIDPEASTASPEQIARNRRKLKIWAIVIALALASCYGLTLIGSSA